MQKEKWILLNYCGSVSFYNVPVFRLHNNFIAANSAAPGKPDVRRRVALFVPAVDFHN